MATDGINLLTMLLIAAFAIERVSAGILFLLQLFHLIDDRDSARDEAQRARAKKKQSLYHFFVSGALVLLVLLYVGDFRFLDALGLGNRADVSRVPLFVDHLLLAVVLVGGAEQDVRVSQNGRRAWRRIWGTASGSVGQADGRGDFP